MSAAPIRSAQASNEVVQVIAQLSENTDVPMDEIEQIYATELNRLSAEARIQTFVSILAIGRTRSILRKGKSKKRSAHR